MKLDRQGINIVICVASALRGKRIRRAWIREKGPDLVDGQVLAWRGVGPAKL